MIVIKLPLPPSENRRMISSARTKRLILTDESRAWKKSAAWDVRAQYRGEPLTGPVKVTLTVHKRSRKNKDGSEHRGRFDIHNFVKIALDSLTGIVYADDSQIDPLIVTKGQPVERGAITLQVEEIA